MERQSGWRIGTLSGIPIYLGRSWVLVALLMVALFGPTVGRTLPGLGAWSYAVALVFVLLLLISVLVHEAAHALVAQRVGFGVSRIVADFWGGHTAHDGAGGTPGRSAAVAVVGPLANGLLALLGWWSMGLFDGTGVPLLLAYAFTWANSFVAVFNLIPGLPLDGGYLLEALVWRLSGNRHVGTMVAGWAGRLVVVLVAIALLLPPLLEGQQVPWTRVAWVALIGLFLWQGASQAIRLGRHGLVASRRRLGDAAVAPGVVDAATPLHTVPWSDHAVWVVLGPDGRPDGLVDPPALQQVPREAWPSTAAEAVAVRLPAGWAVEMDPEATLDGVIEVMRRSGSGVVALLDGQGRPWGVVSAHDLTPARS
ncbi:site-2 protease family protein [Serinicoccus kebangsaanensis]|uniref:site-2 protease family protein n=1 Tax=Serinicoccus kebangsaanensis TaxID=2602069 RepID=UPI00124CB749|nr:site-2 protease family protein [Serinicoccus kebangsaanensis]